MNLYEKIRQLYPELTDEDFAPVISAISLQDNSDGNGPFIAKWEHPTLPRPTEEQLNSL